MISAILLAGGIGSRMQTQMPKQFLSLGNMPVSKYSFDILCGHPLIGEVIVVCDQKYRFHFSHPKAVFADPGARRQDSVQSGLEASSSEYDFVCIHDSARPFLTPRLISEVADAARSIGAAALAVPLKFTIKEANSSGFVVKTPERNRFFEIQTPQAMRKELLWEGFAMADKHNLTVTDDATLVELLEHPVKLVNGSHMNIKITTNEDLILAESYVQAN